MGKIAIEDGFADIINKSQRGLHISDAELAERAGVSAEDLAAVKSGKVNIAVIRRVARHLRLAPNPLEDLARNAWYPKTPNFPRGFAMFNTDCGDMRVNNYLVWDPKTRVAAIFDTGASCEELLHFIRAEKLKVHYLFITHAHDDHIAALDTLVEATGAEVWTHPLEPLPRPGFRQFAEGAYFHIGELAIKTIRTSGHSPGITTFYVTGLSWPLAIVGDSLFAGSMGGSATAFGQQYQNTSSRILTLPKDTVLAPGHGPLTTVSQEKRHNPFFAPRNERASLEDVIQSKTSSNA